MSADNTPLRPVLGKSPVQENPPIKRFESAILIIILVLFFGGLLSRSWNIAGRIVSVEAEDMIEINQNFSSGANISFIISKEVTSIRLSGQFSGSGSAELYLGDLLIVDSQMETPSENKLTGFAVQDLADIAAASITENVSENQPGNLSADEPVFQNISMAPDNDSDALPVPDLPENQITDIINLSVEPNQNNTPDTNQTGTSVNQSLTHPLNNTQVQETGNITGKNETDYLVIEFDNKCFETCYLQQNSGIFTIRIIVDNMTVYLKTLTYTYLEDTEFKNTSAENSVIPENESSTIISEINSSFNETGPETVNLSNSNISINSSFFSNISQNSSYNLSINQSIFDYNLSLVNQSAINLTINQSKEKPNLTYDIGIPAQINITQPVIEISLFDRFKEAASKRDLLILSYQEYSQDLYGLKLGKDTNNFVEIPLINITDVDLSMIMTMDSRISPVSARIGDIGSASVVLAAAGADTVFRCLQYNDSCRKWEMTDIKLEYSGSLAKFEVDSPGIYAVSDVNKKKVSYVPASSVYALSTCENCAVKSDCNAEQFCVSENRQKEGYDFAAQMNFDVLSIEDSIRSASICAYLIYNPQAELYNFLKYTPESYCSDLRNGNLESGLVTARLVTETTGWICIDATDIANEAIKKRHSNLFVTWLGQDIQNQAFPFTCFYGNTKQMNCASPAGDCTPYLKIEYK